MQSHSFELPGGQTCDWESCRCGTVCCRSMGSLMTLPESRNSSELLLRCFLLAFLLSLLLAFSFLRDCADRVRVFDAFRAAESARQ